MKRIERFLSDAEKATPGVIALAALGLDADDLGDVLGSCAVCGEEDPLGARTLFWSPDDGWRYGTLCRWCYGPISLRGPEPGDWAYDRRDDVGAGVFA